MGKRACRFTEKILKQFSIGDTVLIFAERNISSRKNNPTHFIVRSENEFGSTEWAKKDRKEALEIYKSEKEKMQRDTSIDSGLLTAAGENTVTPGEE